MRFLLLALLLMGCSSDEARYSTKHELTGTGGGFMHVVKRQGMIYYYRFSEEPPHLKLHLMLHNTNKKPFRLRAADFRLVVSDQEVLPISKLAWLKEAETNLKNSKGIQQKRLASEVDLLARYMLDEDIQIEPDAPTKTYVLFPIQQALEFGIRLGPASPVVRVKQEL